MRFFTDFSGSDWFPYLTVSREASAFEVLNTNASSLRVPWRTPIGRRLNDQLQAIKKLEEPFIVMPNFSVILAAAGSSSRFNRSNTVTSKTNISGLCSDNKTFASLQGKPVWLYSAERFLMRADVKQVIIVIASDDQEFFQSRFGANIAVQGIEVVLGGKERADSVENGLRAVRSDCEFVVIHDAARPCIDDALIESVFKTGAETGAAIPTIPVNSTVKKSIDGRVIDTTIDRSGLYLAQTPQVYRRETLLGLYDNRKGRNVTDESQLAEINGVAVSMVSGSPLNIKITTPQDLVFAEACLKSIAVPKFDDPLGPLVDKNLFR